MGESISHVLRRHLLSTLRRWQLALYLLMLFLWLQMCGLRRRSSKWTHFYSLFDFILEVVRVPDPVSRESALVALRKRLVGLSLDSGLASTQGSVSCAAGGWRCWRTHQLAASLSVLLLSPRGVSAGRSHHHSVAFCAKVAKFCTKLQHGFCWWRVWGGEDGGVMTTCWVTQMMCMSCHVLYSVWGVEQGVFHLQICPKCLPSALPTRGRRGGGGGRVWGSEELMTWWAFAVF